MTISRYFIYASQIVNNDNTFFLFIFEAAVYFFILYKTRGENKYLVFSSLFIILSFLTKFSFILIIPSLLLFSYLFGKDKFKKDFFVIIISMILPLLILLGSSVALNDPIIFDGPMHAVSYSSYIPDMPTVISNKVFYLASFTWQATPFLAILVLLALFRNKRDKTFFFLSAWMLIVLYGVFLTSGLDFQRYVMIALAPLFILVAKYLENFDFKNITTYIIAAIIIIASFLIALNDMMGFYSPIIIGLFYVAAVLFLLPKYYRKHLLVGGFIALSLYSLVPNVTAYSVGSYSVMTISEKAIELGYPPKEIWGTRDIFLYLTLPNESITVNQIAHLNVLNEDFVKANNIKYLSFYNYIQEERIRDLLRLCKDPYTFDVNGHLVGFVCETSVD